MNAKCILAAVSILGALAVGSSEAHAAGTGAPDWLLTLAPSPISRGEHAMAYDSRRGRLVLFGGYYGSAYKLLGDTWEWDGNTWVERTPATSPSARSGHAMAYDSARGRVVLFGGGDELGFQADTWEWDGNNWLQRTPTVSPPARAYHAMAYDSARGRVVMFSGLGDSAGWLADTWEWDGNNWLQRTPAVSPPARSHSSMAHDSARGRVVLFAWPDTWEWDGNDWLLRTPLTSPPVSSRHAMAFDVARGRVVLFGGGTSYSEETWEWDGSNWVKRTPSTSPPGRAEHAMAYDSARGRVVMFGGNVGAAFTMDDVWEWDGATWVERERTGGPSSRAASAMAYDRARSRLVLFGGMRVPYTEIGDTWERDGGEWIKRTPAANPIARAGHAMAYDEARGRVVLFGGSAFDQYPNDQLADTWEWNGSTWIERTPSIRPSGRSSHAMAYDSARGRVVLFGGQGASEFLGDTWEWDGSIWIERSDASGPPPRSGHAMAYDRARERVVLFGGDSGYSDTWEWDGSTWIERTPLTSPPARSGHAMAYDVARGRVVVFGGYELGDTWEWDGSNWIERTPATAVPARSGHTMAYDEARGRVVLFGGGNFWFDFDDMWEYGPIDACGHAASVVAFTPGSGTDATSANTALGALDGLGLSLGLGGSVEFEIDLPIPNGPGTDLIVHEMGSKHGGLDDSFHVEVSADGIVYRSAGNCSGDDCQLDIAGSLVASARYVRLVDLPPDEGEPAPHAGADIDAVSVVACDACALVDGGADSDGDGTANGCDSCPFVSDDQLDTDGDGAGDACDCAPADPGTRPSAEVLGVVAAKLFPGVVRLTWPEATGAGGYAVTRSLLSEIDEDEFGDCLVPLQTPTTLDDAAIPPVGSAFAYMIQGVDASCGIGTLGAGAGGLERINTDPQACM